MKKSLITAFVFFLFFGSAFTLYAQTNNTTPEPYKEDEFSQPFKDLRRFEIITLGAMPFINLDSAIVYNGYKFATGKVEKFNPLATADYSQKEMEKIIITSLCISAGIGITDYVINLIKRQKIKNRLKLQENSKISIEENPDAVRIPLPEETEQETESEPVLIQIEDE